MMNTKFITKSKDKFGTKHFEIVKGEKIENTFIYDSKLGECEIKYNKDDVVISRENGFECKVCLDKFNNFDYQDGGFKFATYGKKIEYTGKRLDIVYELYEGKTLINCIEFSIKEI